MTGGGGGDGGDGGDGGRRWARPAPAKIRGRRELE